MMPDTRPTSTDAASVRLPTRIPMLIITRWLPPADAAVLHSTDVSDLHSVPSVPVPDSLDRTL